MRRECEVAKAGQSMQGRSSAAEGGTGLWTTLGTHFAERTLSQDFKKLKL